MALSWWSLTVRWFRRFWSRTEDEGALDFAKEKANL